MSPIVIIVADALVVAGVATRVARRWPGAGHGPSPAPAAVTAPVSEGSAVTAVKSLEIAPMLADPEPLRAAGGRIGELLLATGNLTHADLAAGLDEQARSGGRLGEILVAKGAVSRATVTVALARQLGIGIVQPDDEPLPLLDARDARALRAVTLTRTGRVNGKRRRNGRRKAREKRNRRVNGGNTRSIPVALAGPGPDVLAKLASRLDGPVVPKLCDEETLDRLLNRVYLDADEYEATQALREESPELSAFTTRLSQPQLIAAAVVTSAIAVGLPLNLQFTAAALVGFATLFFTASTGFRLYAACQGARAGATVDPPPEALAAMDPRALPVYTILLPLYKEKPSTVRALFEALSCIEYPKHKLDGLLLLEADDDQTPAAVAKVGLPPWIKLHTLPPGGPRTKPRAMGFGLRYARGTFLTVFDAEDKPDPDQLKKAVWGFARADSSLVCLQAKLSYYNPRQNLLTRWFTLEYDAWFNIFLPGLHRIAGPIPLGGTSNHFRRSALDVCLGWDPYNVTEDADLGLRLARLGFTTAMLESTTGEEANSRVPNWIRQRSRWSKGYMQTLLVHTREPRALLRELGAKATAAFLLTIGGAILTALLAPIFWLLLLLWVEAQPHWVEALFPGAIYYAASVSFILGNFLLVFLSLCAAVARGHDDLAPYALITPLYWGLMSIATYVALVELFLRPSHWHKTEHGLHLVEEPA